tara:strand:- start:310 stop:486 length:177 start_codon:yes stop_codon:yes gene_type:complete
MMDSEFGNKIKILESDCAEAYDAIEGLCDALKAVYALAGEVNGVEKIVNDAIEEFGIN